MAYAALGEPAKLSRSNRGKICFRCEERRIDARLERVRRYHRDDDLAPSSFASFYGPRCEVGSSRNRPCKRTAVSRSLSLLLCEEHAHELAGELQQWRAPVDLLPARLSPSEIAAAPEWWYTLSEAADKLQLRPSTVRRYIEADKLEKLRGVHAAERILVTRESVELFNKRYRSRGRPRSRWAG